MSGILLIGAVSLWIWAAVAIGQMLTSRLKDSWFKSLTTLLAVAVLIPLPVVDEVIGRHQLKALCEKNGPKEVEFAKAKNTTLLVHPDPHFLVDDQVLQTIGLKTTFFEITSKKKVLSFTDYQVKGGVLIHVLGISETASPLTFSSGCFSEPFQDWLDRYQIKLVFEHSGENHDYNS